jgi:prenylcysteine oxidase/farnesylcysteine lyase
MVELGGSIFHSSNRYLVHFVEMLGLHQQPSDATETFGIWNGTSFDLKSSPSALLTQLKMLLRYGLTPLRLQRVVKNMVKQLTQVYISQDQGQGFQTPEALFTALNLYALTQQSSYDFFRAQGSSERFLTEFVNGASRNNYGQDAHLNAFVNLVSLAGAGMAGGYLCSVREGNSQLCKGLLRASGAKVRTDCHVGRLLDSQKPTMRAGRCSWMVVRPNGSTP